MEKLTSTVHYVAKMEAYGKKTLPHMYRNIQQLEKTRLTKEQVRLITNLMRDAFNVCSEAQI